MNNGKLVAPYLSPMVANVSIVAKTTTTKTFVPAVTPTSPPRKDTAVLTMNGTMLTRKTQSPLASTVTTVLHTVSVATVPEPTNVPHVMMEWVSSTISLPDHVNTKEIMTDSPIVLMDTSSWEPTNVLPLKPPNTTVKKRNTDFWSKKISPAEEEDPEMPETHPTLMSVLGPTQQLQLVWHLSKKAVKPQFRSLVTLSDSPSLDTVKNVTLKKVLIPQYVTAVKVTMSCLPEELVVLITNITTKASTLVNGAHLLVLPVTKVLMPTDVPLATLA